MKSHQPYLKQPMHRDAGLSLVEMLVALAVIVVIATLLFPGIGTLRKQGLQTRCLANMRSIYVALCSYQADHNGFYPPGKRAIYNREVAQEANESRLGSVDIMNHLRPDYIGKDKTLYCPAMRLNEDGLKTYPNEKKRLGELVGYAIHAYLLQTKPAELPGPRWPKDIPYPGDHKMFVLAEGSSTEPMHVRSHLDNALYGYPGIQSRNTLPRNHRYPDGLNFIFLDGHAETLRRGTPERESSDAWWGPNGEMSRWGENGRFIGPTYADETRVY